MEIYFADENLADHKTRKGMFTHVCVQLERRIKQLEIAKNLTEFVKAVPGARCHQYSDNTFSVDIKGNWRLQFCPFDVTFVTSPEGSIDQELVTSVIILKVHNPH